MPTLPYPFVGGDNSPPINTHSPPASAMTNLPVTPTVLRPQPQLPPSAAAKARPLQVSFDISGLNPEMTSMSATASSTASTAVANNHLSNGSTPSGQTAAISPLRIRVSSPNRINSDLTSIQQQHGLPPHNRANGIVRIGTIASGLNTGISIGPPFLHRPFSPSPQPKDVS